MMQVALIGTGAGAATALLFASVVSGSALSVPLFYLSPLPILIAAMGWSHWAALIAAFVASASLAAVFGAFFFIAFMLAVALPAWWLGYLALLARPAAVATPDGLEWYPFGHLVFWAAIIGAAIIIIGMLTLGSDLEGLRSSLRRGLERILKLSAGSPWRPDAAALDSSKSSQTLDTLVTILPPAAAVAATVTNVANLWLAERVVKISGRLHRPPFDLPSMRFPVYAPALVGAAVVACLLPGIIGTLAGVLAASLLMAYAILGFAVLHMITRGMSSRSFMLGGIYVAVFMATGQYGWPVLAISLLGLADTAFDLRGRTTRWRGPPNPQT